LGHFVLDKTGNPAIIPPVKAVWALQKGALETKVLRFKYVAGTNPG
jgi:hypothetical protein